MECQNITKNLKINKNKSIGTIVIVVEGENDEFRLLKHIFTEVFDYSYISLKRNKIMQHEFVSKDSKNTVIVANTNSSNIKSIIDDSNYKDKLYNLLKKEFNKNLKNTRIYIIWDRDKDSSYDEKVQEYYIKAINTFYSSFDNNYDMNGLLLISYPCHEAYNLSNFEKKLYREVFSTSNNCKREFNESRYNIKKINEKTLLLAVENMHRGLINYDIHQYDPSNLKLVNNKVYRKEEEQFKTYKNFNALSLISMMLIDLGIIEEK